MRGDELSEVSPPTNSLRDVPDAELSSSQGRVGQKLERGRWFQMREMQRLPFSSDISEMKDEIVSEGWGNTNKPLLSRESMVKWEEIELIVNRTKEQPILGKKKKE